MCYQIEGIVWNKSPQTQKFEWKQRNPENGFETSKSVTVAEYIKEKYPKYELKS